MVAHPLLRGADLTGEFGMVFFPGDLERELSVEPLGWGQDDDDVCPANDVLGSDCFQIIADRATSQVRYPVDDVLDVASGRGALAAR